MEKLLTKNSTLSILASIFIIAGAFWTRLANQAKETEVSSHDNTAMIAVYQKDTRANNETLNTVDPSIAQPWQTDPIIKVADLPWVNGIDPTNTNVPALPESSIETPSTLAYDEISNKATLYPEGTGRYGVKDVPSIVTSNRASLTAYGVNFTEAIAGYPFYKELSPTEVTFNIYNKKADSSNGLATLKEMGSSYNSAKDSLLQMTVPTDLVDLHIRLINNFDRISQLLINMEMVDNDKLLALNSARQYVEEAKYTLAIFAELNAFYMDKNITFGKENVLKLSINVIK